MRRVLVVLAIASLAGCREDVLLEDRSTGPLPEHAVTGGRPLFFVDDTIHFSQIDEFSEDLQWRLVLDSLQSSGSFDFDPARDIYDVVDFRHEPPPPELLFQYATIVWNVKETVIPSALRQIGQFCTPAGVDHQGATESTDVLSLFLDKGGELWICGERPALTLWPVPDLLPACIADCDDPGAANNSLLFRMGVECFDLGSSSILMPPRNNSLQHGCRGVLSSKAMAAPLLIVNPLWPLPADPALNQLGTRPNIEIYNIPVFFGGPQPPPRTGVAVGYTYVSGVPAGNGVEYPSTADLQPVLLLNKREVADANYSRAFSGFEPWRLTLPSHFALAHWVLAHHMGVGMN